MPTVHHTHCPVCDSARINPLLTVKDHSVSGEDFVLWQCTDCSLRFTQDVPDESAIGAYYQSPEYISHTNTSKGLVNRIYQRVRNYTLDQKADLVIARTKKTGKILDLGAGIGAFLHTMQKKGWETEGIEPDPGARAQAESLYQLQLHDTTALDNFSPASFDAITLWHVLEHVHKLHPYMDRLHELLQPGGRIFIAVPNYESLDAADYKLFWAAYDVPRHLYHFSPKSMETLVQRHGFTLEEKRPMWFDSFYISLLSSKYKNGKTNWPGALWSGARSNLKAAANKNYCSSLIYILKKN